jgi:two-component system response regulator HupR/HoxA
VRIIAATNRDLEADVASGRFRRDLYYRIAGIGLHMPSLRERPQDIPLIVGGLLKESALGGTAIFRAAPVMKNPAGLPWPGNVRELQNEVMRALALGEGDLLGEELLSPRLRVAGAMAGASFAIDGEGGTLKDQLDNLEGQVIAATMERHKGNKTRVAEELGLTRVGLRMKLERLGLKRDDE